MRPLVRSMLTGLFAVLLCPLPAASQTYPDRAVRVIIPFAPGGSNDLVGRIVFQRMTKLLGRQFVIDNRPGAGGTLGAAIVAKSPPDGYTIMMHSVALLSSAHLSKPPYDTLRDFIGVTPLAKQFFVLVVHSSMPVKSVAEFITLAKARPGQIVYGSGGEGTTPHLAMALFNFMTHTNMIHVPYKGGGPATLSLVAGETQAIMANIGVLLQHIQAGRVRPLAVSSNERLKEFPNIPTIGETVPRYEFNGWIACFVPAHTPSGIVDSINAALLKTVEDPAIAAELSAQTFYPTHSTPEEFKRVLKAEYDNYGVLIRQTAVASK